MSNWIHLSLNFKDYQGMMIALHQDAIQDRPTGVYKELIGYLKNTVDSLLPDLIYRYFYLFEETPHLFLALELKDINSIEVIKARLALIAPPDFIDSVKIDLNTSDEGNGEAAVDFFWAGTKYAFYRIGDAYKPGYYNNDEVKIVHCFNNQLFVDWDNEVQFYLKCLSYRGAKKVNVHMTDGRIIESKRGERRDC